MKPDVALLARTGGSCVSPWMLRGEFITDSQVMGSIDAPSWLPYGACRMHEREGNFTIVPVTIKWEA